MTGTPNAKRLLNEAFRAKIEDVRCALAKLADKTRGFDGDLIEAVCLKAKGRRAVAEKAAIVDENFSDRMGAFLEMIEACGKSYDEMRAELDLG